MKKMPQRALKCLIIQTDLYTPVRIYSHAHSYTHSHTYTRTPVERSTVVHQNNTSTHTPKHRSTHTNNTLANGKQTIQTPTPEQPQHQRTNSTKLFSNHPTKASPIHQSLCHSTKASVSYSLPPAHRTAPPLYAAALNPAQHRSCIGTLHQEQNDKTIQT